MHNKKIKKEVTNEKDLYKLLKYAFKGKTMESIRNRKNVVPNKKAEIDKMNKNSQS